MATENLGRVVGFSILSGAGVPSGGLGDNGDSYLNTANGDVYSKVGGAWSITGNIQGIQGEQGFSILSGAGAPTTQGVNGDTYLNTTNGDVYLKSSGSWGSPTGSIRGPQGIQGIQGPIGISTTNMTTAGTILGLNTADSVPQSPKQLLVVGASIVANVFTINYQNAVTAYNAASGVDTPLTNAMSPAQMFQNLQKQSDNRYTKTQSDARFLPLSLYNYSSTEGVLIKTDILDTTDTMFTLYLKGNGYTSEDILSIDLQGYLYVTADNILAVKAISTGFTTTVYAFKYNGFLHFWMQYGTAVATTLIATCYTGFSDGAVDTRGAKAGNRITSMVESAKPTIGVTSEVSINPKKVLLNDGSSSNLILGNGTYQALSTLPAFTATKLIDALGTAPASATATGIAGTVIFTTDYIYVCTATNTWKRIALTTW